MKNNDRSFLKAEPTRWQAIVFSGKAWVHRMRRVIRRPGHEPRALDHRALAKDGSVIAHSASPLYSTDTEAEFALQAGKVQNLRRVAASLNGLFLPAGEVFSFWKNVPRPTARRGYAPGRELREGCVIPSIGGGLCQLTNSLYDAALTAGFEIVERHAHSRRLPGSMAEIGRDATVFWNYVDLRFRATGDIQIEVRLSRWKLTVAYRQIGEARAPSTPAPRTVTDGAPAGPEAESCETCGVTSCFRNPSAGSLPKRTTTAWLVDAYWPEHDRYMATAKAPGDTLLLPLRSKRFRLGPYHWSTEGYARVRQFPAFTMMRSLASRKLATQGPARQRALLEMDERLAAIYEKHIPYTALHLVVSQNLLPFLWRRGVLGGRSFDVLMTRLPLAHIESQLENAAAVWPEARMLRDFRADDELVAAEAEALAAAGKWITPHTAVAALAPDRTQILPWEMPSTRSRSRGKSVVFPASTLARKGARELREVAREMGIPIALGGPVIEGHDFWNGCDIRPVEQGNWLGDASLVVLPAWVENQPRRLLSAIAAGIPVIATEACGVTGLSGVRIVPHGSVSHLATAIAEKFAPVGDDLFTQISKNPDLVPTKKDLEQHTAIPS